eukprot:1385062-Amorphochlora_amoeboformis.AAC.1
MASKTSSTAKSFSTSRYKASSYDFFQNLPSPPFLSDSGHDVVQSFHSPTSDSDTSTVNQQETSLKRLLMVDNNNGGQERRRGPVSRQNQLEFLKNNSSILRGDLLMDFMPKLFTLDPGTTTAQTFKMTSSRGTEQTNTIKARRRPSNMKRNSLSVAVNEIDRLRYDDVDLSFHLCAHHKAKRDSSSKRKSRQSKLSKAWIEAQYRLSRRCIVEPSLRSPNQGFSFRNFSFVPPKWEVTPK